MSAARYRFAEFELEPDAPELRRGGKAIRLQELPLRLLVRLVEADGAVVTRDELYADLWPEEDHLGFDNSLNAAMSRLRRALGGAANGEELIATVPRRGYRFAAPVERIAAGAGQTAATFRWRRPAVAVSIALAAGFGLWSLSAARQRAAREPSPAVRENLLRARHFEARHSREGLEKAIAAYQSVLALEPDSAEAYSGLAMAFTQLGVFDYWRPAEAFTVASRMVGRALELDGESGRAQLASGLLAAFARWDWQAAAEALDRAVELSGGDTEALGWRGMARIAMGCPDDGLADLERAVAAEPLSATLRGDLCWGSFLARRFDEAVAVCREAIELDPSHLDPIDNLKWVLTVMGREAEAAAAFERVVELEGGEREDARRFYEKHGWEALLRESIETKLRRDERGYQSAYDLAIDYAAVGELESALRWLERSVAERETDLAGLRVDPRLDPVRELPGYRPLEAALGFPAGCDDTPSPPGARAP